MNDLSAIGKARDAQGLGIGRLLLGHAMNCGVAMRANAGAGLLVVDAKDERAAAFYRLHGFRETAHNALTLYLPLGKA